MPTQTVFKSVIKWYFDD